MISRTLVRYQPNTGGHVHYHLDALGNVQFLLSGELHLGLEKYTYDVFGKPTITGWNGGTRPISLYGNRFLFTGREYLYTLGIYDYRHRYYHPELGRFIQTDPLGLQIEGAKLSAQQTALYPAGAAPKTFSSSELNLYRYCHSDPVNKTDPTGLYWDLREYDHANNWKIWQMILAVQRLPVGDPVGDRFRAIDRSPIQVIVLPIQSDPAARDKYGLGPRDAGDTRNMTSSNDPENDKNNVGTNSRIEFDPNNAKDPDGNPRAPIDALVHEAAGHAYGNLTGTKLPGGGDPKQPEEKRALDIQKLGHESLKKAEWPYNK